MRAPIFPVEVTLVLPPIRDLGGRPHNRSKAHVITAGRPHRVGFQLSPLNSNGAICPWPKGKRKTSTKVRLAVVHCHSARLSKVGPSVAAFTGGPPVTPVDKLERHRNELNLFWVPLSQPHPGAAAVLVDELDAGDL